MDDRITQGIRQDAIDGVQRASVDGTSVDAMSVADRILADQHVSGQAAKQRNHCGLVFRKLEPGGCG